MEWAATAVGIAAPEVILQAKKALGPGEYRLLEKELRKITNSTCKAYLKTYPQSAVAQNPEGVWQTVLQCLATNRPITYDELEFGDKRVSDQDRECFFALLEHELSHSGAWFMRHSTAIQSKLQAVHEEKNDAQHQEMLALLQKIDEQLAGSAYARAKQNPLWLHWDSAYLRHNHDFVGHDPEDEADIVSRTCDQLDGAYPFASGFAYCIAGEGGIGKTEVCREALVRTLIQHPALKALYIDATDVKTVKDLNGKIHAALGHGAEVVNEDIIPYLAREAAEDGLLLYLDNLEDLIWGPEEKEAWQWIERLSRTDSCAVLMSSRERPGHIPGDAVASLTAEAALQLYGREYARVNQGKKSLTPQEEDLLKPFLNNELEGHPLSIVMMAGQTYFFTVEESFLRWWELKSIDPPGEMDRKSLYHSTLLTYNAMQEKGWQDAIRLWALHTAWRTRATANAYRIAGIQQAAIARLMCLGVLRREGDTYRILNPLQEFMRQHYPIQEPEQWQQILTETLNAYIVEQKAIVDDGTMDERMRLMHEEYEHLIYMWEAYWQGKDKADDLLADLFVLFLEDCKIYATAIFEKIVIVYSVRCVDRLRAIALFCLGELALHSGRLNQAGERYRQAEALFRQAEDWLGLSNVLANMGDLDVRENQFTKASERYRQAEVLYREVGDQLGLANVLVSLGDLDVREDRFPIACERYQQAEALFHEMGNRFGLACVLASLGDLDMREKRLVKASERYLQAEALFREVDDRLGLANVLRRLGDLDTREDRFPKANEKYLQAEALYREIENRLGLANVLTSLGDLDMREARLAEAGERYRQAEILYRDIGDQLGLMNVLCSYACLHCITEDISNLARVLREMVSVVPHAYAEYLDYRLRAFESGFRNAEIAPLIAATRKGLRDKSTKAMADSEFV